MTTVRINWQFIKYI